LDSLIDEETLSKLEKIRRNRWNSLTLAVILSIIIDEKIFGKVLIRIKFWFPIGGEYKCWLHKKKMTIINKR
jgi:hypothetical protein